MNNKNLAYRTVLREEGRVNADKGPAKLPMSPLIEPLAQIGVTNNEKTNKVFVLDTCYLIRLAKSSYGLYRSLKELAEKGDVIITEQVVEELQRNAKSKGDVKKEDIAELYRAINYGTVAKERVDVSPEEHATFSNIMKENSGNNNSRLGKGDASIVALVVNTLKGLYDTITVLSEDSDIYNLLRQMDNIIVKSAA